MASPVITAGILTGGSNSHQTTSEEVNAVATDFISEGIVGSFTNTSGVAPATGAFAVNATATPDANINISTGVGYVTATPTSQNSQALRVKCTTTGTLAISSNSSGSTKYDWIYISISATNAANPAVGADNVATIVASRSTSASTDDGTPPTYSYPIAVVTVANGFSTITNGNIRDVRANSIVNLGSSSVSSGWVDLGYNPNTITALGNRSYSLVFNSTDLTSTLSPGMRLKTTRLVTAPTQCTDLESTSSQYYSKTSPAAMTFTDDFVISGWVKLESYPAEMTIASRYNGTSGWRLDITTTGVVSLTGFNAGAANFSQINSYQSVPLGKWVHVAAQLDMSTFTATPTTSYVMLDGLDVPAQVSRGGTNPTALVQAGNLEIGGQNGGTLPFDGKLAQVAIYNAKVTQTTIRASLSQTLSGSETSLISAYSFSNSINDLSANANNLTAQGSAVATSADSPFSINAFGTTVGTTDYAIITSSTFSTNTTLTVQVPEGCTVPTTGGVSAVSYSTQKAPYGLPSDKGKWGVLMYAPTTGPSVAMASANTWYSNSLSSTVPVGPWILGYDLAFQGVGSTGFSYGILVLSPATPTNTDQKSELTSMIFGLAAPGQIIVQVSRRTPVQLSTATTYIIYTAFVSASGTVSAALRGDTAPTVIYAEFAYI